MQTEVDGKPDSAGFDLTVTHLPDECSAPCSSDSALDSTPVSTSPAQVSAFIFRSAWGSPGLRSGCHFLASARYRCFRSSGVSGSESSMIVSASSTSVLIQNSLLDTAAGAGDLKPLPQGFGVTGPFVSAEPQGHPPSPVVGAGRCDLPSPARFFQPSPDTRSVSRPDDRPPRRSTP